MYYNMKDVPTTEDAVDMYQQQSGVLTDPSEFGTDPIDMRDQREQEFRSNTMSVEDIIIH